jgi:hypothetical protein
LDSASSSSEAAEAAAAAACVLYLSEEGSALAAGSGVGAADEYCEANLTRSRLNYNLCPC